MVTLSARARARMLGCCAQYPTRRRRAARRVAPHHATPRHATPRRAAPNGWERKRSEPNQTQTDRFGLINGVARIAAPLRDSRRAERRAARRQGTRACVTSRRRRSSCVEAFERKAGTQPCDPELNDPIDRAHLTFTGAVPLASCVPHGEGQAWRREGQLAAPPASGALG